MGFPDGNELFWTSFIGEPLVQDGYITLPDKPGLGIEIDWEAINPLRVA